ncbi:LacI family DNA-binding transcriptional regulator [Murimonas intestini]|uniref:LacI family transcriptional regulator n=1 Tax=Murimonas intestini TaxID=1337051 RepID=A0AB73T0Z7_9FIRM|nr:LacI family DNA-binding transcriptional regulator [Murimonas intestini]MCR1840360.1 LacI family transcriptional regulator [Murimonas intestini]MCR1867529.1 LacI family transcriptional regulator [Murimonas intestini]MCR1884716.1 LacI family transcriptional regulator [Murimonas intestini]
MNTIKKKLTIDDIARLANVSRSTVSRVLNNNPNVNEAKRKRIMDIIDEQHFVPNSMARNLGTGSTRTIAIFVGEITNQYFSEIIRGAEEVAISQGYFPLICLIQNPGREQFYIEEMIQQRASGAIIVSSSIKNAASIRQLAMSMSLVSIQSELCGIAPLYYLDTENQLGIYNITKHLIQLGHRNLAYLSTLPNTTVLEERYAGFCKACSDFHLSFAEDHVLHGYHKEDISVSVENLILSENRPTALCCCNDFSAGIAYQKIRQLGLRIPEDISLTGFDDLPIATIMNPMLTTVKQPIREMGRRAMKLLIESLDNAENPVSGTVLRFPSEVILRESTAPPAAI